jgi:hypothetical protein
MSMPSRWRRTERRIRSVTGLDTRTGKETRFRGKFFSDCTGHGSVGFLAGAEIMMEEKGRMGMSNMWVLKKSAQAEALAGDALGAAAGVGRLSPSRARWSPWA